MLPTPNPRARTDEVPNEVPICDLCIGPTEDRWLLGAVGFDATCVRCESRQSSTMYFAAIQDPKAEFSGSSPLWFAPTAALSPPVRLVFDTNGWYRDLGVPTDATRRQIMERLVEIGEARDDHLTYVAKMLLDRETRERYDAIPLGRAFMDRYLIEAERQRTIAANAKAIEEGALDAEDVWDVDGTLKAEEERQAERRRLMPAFDRNRNVAFPVAYYAWGVTPDAAHAWFWQQAIIEAFQAAGVCVPVAVGLMAPGESPVRITPRPQGPVLYLAADVVDPTTMSQVGAMLAEHVRSN